MTVKAATVRATAVAVTLAVETTVLTGIPAAGQNASSVIDQTIKGVVNVTAGTGATAVTIRCKKSDGTTQVGTSQVHTLAAGASANIAFEFQDASGANNASYQITLQQTAATANGTANEIVAHCEGEG